MANRYFLNIGANWGDTANWSDTSGGTGGFSVPTNADDVFFDANSGNCTVNASTRTAKTLNFTGYTNTITMTFGITVSGNVTLSATMTIAGASGLTVNATGNLTSNGKTWPNPLTLSGTSQTYTLIDNWTISGLITFSSSTAVTVNGFKIFTSGGVTTAAAGVMGGTTILEFTGGTLSSPNATLRFNTRIVGNLTITGTVSYSNATITYVSGTVTLTGNTMSFGGTMTLNTSGMNWNNLIFAVSSTITLGENLNINGLLTIQATTVNGSFNINANGGISLGNVMNRGTGTPILNLLGGTWSTTGANGLIYLNTNINGNITISGAVYYLTGILTYIAGTVKANTATLNVVAATTFINCDKINFKAIIITAGTTQTMNKFFSGSAIQQTRISSTGANYTIAFQDGFEKITKFTKISNCTVSRPGQLLCITDKSNKGGNVGVRYINQMPNRVPLNNPSTANPLGYATSTYLLADPNTILI